MVNAQIIGHSVNPWGIHLISWLLTYPRFIHAEFMTHRVFSRNAASSRAIPLQHTIDSLLTEPALPAYWGEAKKGMAPGEELAPELLAGAKADGNFAMRSCIEAARMAGARGLHKSIPNRWLEPWSHIKVVATSTGSGLMNFFSLRCHPMAEPTFQVLAFRMLREYSLSVPEKKELGEWHIPFLDFATKQLSIEDQLKVATARACWTSYARPDKLIDGTITTWDDAIQRHDSAVSAAHWSPFEHCAQAVHPEKQIGYSNFDCEGGLNGWEQYRKMFPTEFVKSVDVETLLATKPSWIVDAD